MIAARVSVLRSTFVLYARVGIMAQENVMKKSQRNVRVLFHGPVTPKQLKKTSNLKLVRKQFL